MKRLLRGRPSLLGRGAHRPALGIILLLAAAFRLWRLGSLPPGLTPGEASLALSAHGLLAHGLSTHALWSHDHSPLMVLVTSLAEALFGTGIWPLRLLPALLGVATVALVYALARDLFNRRSGLIVATLYAVVPWAVALNRGITAASVVPFFMAASLYAGLVWWRDRSRLALSASIVLIILELLLGPGGWAVIFVGSAIAVALGFSKRDGLRGPVIALLGIIVGLLPAVLTYIFGHATLDLATSVTQILQGIGQTLSAFLFHGDDSYQYNLGGQPLLNTFVGIMLVAGLLVTATRLRRLAYRLTGLSFIVALLPTMLTNASTPSAGRMAVALIPALLIAGVGIGYMLEIWYTTFPINSAARLTGQSAIVILLVLSALQGYNQYFVAWAQSSPTYGAYSERALALAHWVTKQPTSGHLIISTQSTDLQALTYGLIGDRHQLTITTAAKPDPALFSKKPLELGVSAASVDAVIPVLKSAAPGGTLVPHLSSFDQSELFYSYAAH